MTHVTRMVAPMDLIDEIRERPLPAGSAELLEKHRTRLGGRRAVYLSTPITTGPRLLEALKNPLATGDDGYLHQVRDEVIAANIRGVRPLRGHLAAAFKGLDVIDPTELEVPGWAQRDYHRYWVEVIEQFVDVIVFADGWHISNGCTVELVTASAAKLRCLDARLSLMTAEYARELLEIAIEQLEQVGLDAAVQRTALGRLQEPEPRVADDGLKDDLLAAIALAHNVASFVSIGPDLSLRYLAIDGLVEHKPALSLTEAVQRLMARSLNASLNVRTFKAEPSKSNPFLYGLRDPEEVVAAIRAQAADGYFTIVNETIDVHDGGVSGVSLGGVLEFAPDDTPRVVEGSGTAMLPTAVGRKLLSVVYGTRLDIPSLDGRRYEFSVHPRRVGHRRSHLVLWELEPVSSISLEAHIAWPNQFSRLVGDKTYGLLLADACGAMVPRTRAVLRRVAPFEFGVSTGTNEWWLRTAPAEQTPGHFTTTPWWSDPFELLAREDESGLLAGVLSQEGVDSAFSGATAIGTGSKVVVEGIAGTGDAFMLGRVAPQELPTRVEQDVIACVRSLSERVGSVRIEWAHDGSRVWVLQMHRASQQLQDGVLSPGTAEEWIGYRPSEGLDRLNDIIEKALESSSGIEVLEPVGITSHVGDLVRRAGVPTRFAIRL